MKSFLTKIIIFSIPLITLFLFPGAVVVLGREYVSFKDVVTIQQKSPEALFGFAYNGASFYMYKKQLVNSEKPKVIALGTSRVMQFRKEFFTEDTHFINAGGAGKTVYDIEQFVTSLPKDTSVKIIILGLDKDVFTAPYVLGDKHTEEITPIRFTKLCITMARRIYLDYASHKYTMREIYNAYTSTNHIGISALVHGDGFRTDGSYRYGGAMHNPSRVSILADQIDVQVEDISKASQSFSDEEKENFKINSESLTRTLAYAKDHGIVVVGFMPPYPTPVYDAMTKQNNSLEYISQEFKAVFKERGMYFIDVSSIGVIGGKETEFVDTNHGTDMLYMKIVNSMYGNTSLLPLYIDIQKIRNSIKNNPSDFYTTN